jgi:hypothetical protein
LSHRGGFVRGASRVLRGTQRGGRGGF